MRLAVSKYAKQAFNNDFGKLATLSTGFLLFLILIVILILILCASLPPRPSTVVRWHEE